jgi:hypothetical protein
MAIHESLGGNCPAVLAGSDANSDPQQHKSIWTAKERLLLLSMMLAEMCGFASNTVIAPLYPKSVSVLLAFRRWSNLPERTIAYYNL